jgi:alpha-mannosidase
MNRHAMASFAFCLFSTLVTYPAAAQTTTLWKIGKPDHSWMEFTAPAAAHVVYTVGTSDWAKDWPGEEKTESDYEIRFDLKSDPRGVFLLKIDALTGYRENPDLKVEVNGHGGRFYLHSEPLYDGTSFAIAPLSIALPAADLHRGRNTLVLTPVSSQAAAALGEGAGTKASSESLRYDDISLENDPTAAQAKEPVTADVVPSIFYRKSGDELVEIVDAYLRFARKNAAGGATLRINGKEYKQEIAARNDFGEEHLVFEIPAWSGTQPAALEISAGVHATLRLSLVAEREWTVFVAPHTHVDIGYTDYQGKVAENQAAVLDEAADLIGEHPDFRFSTDGSWNVQQLLETRDKTERERVLNLIKNDKIGMPADYFNLLTGYASLETLNRSLYYSKRLSREAGLPFNYATTTDVPSYTGAYPSVLAAAGVKYWAVGGNGDRAPVLQDEQWDEKSPFWWQGPDGGRVLFWYSRGYSEINRIFTLDPHNAQIHEALPLFLAPYDRPEYKPDAVLMYGAQNENTDLHAQLATFVNRWNEQFAYPKLEYATFPDFFAYIESHFGDALATHKGDLGSYWEDGIASDAFFAAEDRRNQSDALATEILSTAAHTMDPTVHAPKAELDDAWKNILLFAEHTWGAARSISEPDSEESVRQLAVKDNYATQAGFDLEDIRNRSLYQLANQVQAPSRTILVFNGLSWQRSALVETDLHDNEQLVDLATKREVPLETLSDQEHFRHVRFRAEDLPPVGYKCYEIRSAASPQAAMAASQMSPVVENAYYRITLDPASGAVRSIFDKQLQREIVDANSPYRFGQYLYVTGGDPHGDGQTRMIHPSNWLPPAELVVHPSEQGEYLGTAKTPWGYLTKLRSSDVNTPSIDLEIMLFDAEKKIEFRYSVEKTYTTAKEGVYFSFPAAVTSPNFVYDSQQGWVNPARDMLKGADLEWFSVQKWAAVYNADLAVGIVPIDAPLVTFGDINRGRWPQEFRPETSTIFSYVMDNYWHTNYRAGQGGRFTFRYVVTSSDRFAPAAMSRLGLESMEAPMLDVVTNQDKAGDTQEPLPATGASFLNIDNPNVELVTWKRAEDGKGTILRLKEIAGMPEEANVKLLEGHVDSAALCDAMEDDEKALPNSGNGLHVTLEPNQVLTVRVVLGAPSR